MGELFNPIHLIILLVIAIPIFAINTIPFWIIFRKAGFEPLLSLLAMIPLVNLIVLYYVALSEWPARQVNTGL